MKKNKVLIIRFSSFGDIVQCSTVSELIHQSFGRNGNECSVEWATRSEFEYLIRLNSSISKVWSLDKKKGILGIIKFSLFLRSQNFTHVYDAHNNLRSLIIRLFLLTRLNPPSLIIRSKNRWKRIVLFYFKKNLFPNPFKGIDSYINPLGAWNIQNKSDSYLVKWNFQKELIESVNQKTKMENTIILVPSAAWEMKRWPVAHWEKLVELLSDKKFIILGGKEDFQLSEEIAEIDRQRVQNLAGKLSLVESCYIISKSLLVISADTGLLHVTDVLGVKGLSLMGPTAFGFTAGPGIKTLEVNLPCRPCTKDGSGKCSQAIWQQCMVEIEPSRVANEVLNLIHA